MESDGDLGGVDPVIDGPFEGTGNGDEIAIQLGVVGGHQFEQFVEITVDRLFERNEPLVGIEIAVEEDGSERVVY